VEIISAPHRNPFFPPIARAITVLFAAGFVAYQLGKGEVSPAMLLAVATVVGLVVAIQLVPHGPLHVRKPEQDLDENGLRKDHLKPAILKRAYSPPHLMQFESREFLEPASESIAEDGSFRLLRPFYVVYPNRDYTAIAASLKFHGDKDYRCWHPVADSVPQQPNDGLPDEHYQWILIGYVPPNAYFDAKLKLRDPQLRLGVAVVENLIVPQDRPFQSVHLKIPGEPPKHFAASE
jgi:hypothetical protein